MQISTDEAGSRGPANLTLKVAGDKMRVEMDMSGMMGGGRGGGRGGEMTAGAFMLLQPDGKVAVILPSMPNPMGGGMGMGMLMDLTAMRAGGRGGRGGPPIEVSDIKFDVTDLGAGEPILGHATHKYRFHETYKSGSEATPHDVTSDAWFSTDLGGAEEGFRKFSESFGAQFGSGNAAKPLVDARRAKMPKGFPMKMVSTTAKAEGKTVTTMEVTRIGKMSFEASDFEVPAGIQVMDLGALMGGRGRGGL